MIKVSTTPRKNPGDQAKADPGRERERDHDQADDQGEARAIDDPREDVAPDRVGAEQKLGGAAGHPERRCEEVIAELLGRQMRRDPIGEHRPEDHGDDDDQPADRTLVLAEVVPELAQRPGRRFRGGRLGEEIEAGCHGRFPGITWRSGCED